MLGGILPRPRAFGARCLEEEKHMILSRAHEAMARRCRWEHLSRDGSMCSLDEAREAQEQEDELLEEFDEQLGVYASPEVMADREAMLQAMAASGTSFDRCSLELRGDADVALAAIQNTPGAWHHTSNGILADRSGILRVVRTNGRALEFVGPDLQDDKEITLAAVSSDPFALSFANDRLKADREVVLAALIRQQSTHDRSESVLQFVTSEDLLSDRGILLAAIESKPWAVTIARGVLRHDRELMMAALSRQTDIDLEQYDRNVFQEASHELRKDEEVVLQAIRFDPFALEFASAELRKNKDFVLRALRAVSPLDRECCYEEADEEVRRSASLADFEEAADATALAISGDQAPVLTVALYSSEQSQQQQQEGSTPTSRTITSCQVTLLSGASFTCRLDGMADSSVSTGSCQSLDSGRSASEPAQKRAKSVPAEGPGQAQQHQQQPLTVAELASLLLAELPQHLEVGSPVNSVFIVFTSGNDNADSVSVTPWDWNRPVAEFV